MFKSEPIIPIRVTVLIEQDNGVFYAYSPSMPGLHVEGETEAEVKDFAREAVSVYLSSLLKHNEPLPMDATIQMPAHAKPYSFVQQLPAFA